MEAPSAMLTEPELVDWGKRIGREAEPPLFIALRGDLGTGKSTLARAIARGAGVEGDIPSPTFNLLFRYPSSRRLELAHLDLHRLRDPEEVWELGWGELPGPHEIVLVEWPERAEALLPDDRWEVALEEGPDDAARRVSLRRVGAPEPIPAPQVRR